MVLKLRPGRSTRKSDPKEMRIPTSCGKWNVPSCCDKQRCRKAVWTWLCYPQDIRQPNVPRLGVASSCPGTGAPGKLMVLGMLTTPHGAYGAKVGAPTPFSASLSFTFPQSCLKPGLMKFLAVQGCTRSPMGMRLSTSSHDFLRNLGILWTDSFRKPN